MSCEPYTQGFGKVRRWHSGGRLYEFEGQMLRCSDISVLTGIPVNTIRARLQHGLSPEEAFRNIDYRGSEFKPKKKNEPKLYNYNGEALTKKQICEREGISMDVLNYRIYTKKLFERIRDD